MKRIALTAVLALASALALAEPPGPPRGPPVEEITAKLGLDATQTAQVKTIFEAAHTRMEAAMKANMQQVDTELAQVLSAEQVTEFKKLMRESHHRGPPPGPPPSSN